jgi:rhodanese-related sulfurtransferase
VNRSVKIMLLGFIPVLAAAGVLFAAGKAHGPESAEEGYSHKRGKNVKPGDELSCFDDVCVLAEKKGEVKEITYEQFQKIRSSGEDYVLLDALPEESYASGHIEGAESFPVDEINAETAAERLSKSDNIIVYCGSFSCAASTKAARKLQSLGYENVLDYKGGLKDWQERGNELVR